MKNLGTALLSLLGNAAAPGFAFIGRISTGIFGRSDGGLGISIIGTEVARYESDGRKISREIEYTKGYQFINGGGLLSYINGCVKWTNRFIMCPVATALDSARFIEILMPATGVNIAVEGATARAVTSDGIPLQSWETIFAIHTPGAAVQLYIGSYNSGVVIKDNYIPVCTRNDDLGFVRFCDGKELYPGKASYNRAGVTRVDANALGFTFDDGATPYTLSKTYDSRSFSSGYTIDSICINAASNEKRWRWYYSPTSLSLECVTDAYDAAYAAIHFLRSGTTITKTSIQGHLFNITDNTYDIGGSSNRWKNIWLANQPTVSSDERYKYGIRGLSNSEIKAWESVSPRIFRIRSIEGPGDQHVGYIAQDVERAFAAQGLDAFAYGLLTRPNPGGYMSLRYGEAAVFEAAYQRSRVATLEKQVAILAASIGVDLPEE